MSLRKLDVLRMMAAVAIGSAQRAQAMRTCIQDGFDPREVFDVFDATDDERRALLLIGRTA